MSPDWTDLMRIPGVEGVKVDPSRRPVEISVLRHGIGWRRWYGIDVEAAYKRARYAILSNERMEADDGNRP